MARRERARARWQPSEFRGRRTGQAKASEVEHTTAGIRDDENLRRAVAHPYTAEADIGIAVHKARPRGLLHGDFGSRGATDQVTDRDTVHVPAQAVDIRGGTAKPAQLNTLARGGGRQDDRGGENGESLSATAAPSLAASERVAGVGRQRGRVTAADKRTARDKNVLKRAFPNSDFQHTAVDPALEIEELAERQPGR